MAWWEADWLALARHPASILSLALYPVYFRLSAAVLSRLGLDDPAKNLRYLCGQQLRATTGVVVGLASLYTLATRPHYAAHPFTNFHSDHYLDALAASMGFGFNIGDTIELVRSFRLGLIRPAKWDLVVHHLAVVSLGFAYKSVRAEGIMCGLFLAETVAIPMYFVALGRAYFRQGLFTRTAYMSWDLTSKIVRTVQVLARLPMWVYLFSVLRQPKFAERAGDDAVYYRQLRAFLVLIFVIDVWWSWEMVGSVRRMAKIKSDITTFTRQER